MIKLFSLNNAFDMKQWDEFVKSHPKGTPFHLSGWLCTIYETYKFKPLLYVNKTEDKNITSIFPLFLIKAPFSGSRIVSLPFSDYGGPLCTTIEQENEFLKEIIKTYKDKVNYVAVRSALMNSNNFIHYNYYKRLVLNLQPQPPFVLKKIDKRTIQYSIRKAQKSGVTIIEENNENGLEEFFRLNKLTRKKHGVPSQPNRFFTNLLTEMNLNGYISILLAIYNSRTIAAGLFLKFKDTVYYKYNASDTTYLSKLTPNHLLTWHAIEQACLDGYSFFDFGRTSPDNNGLMRYKIMWGATPFDLPYYYYPKIAGATSEEGTGIKYRLFTTCWRYLPDFLTDFISPRIFKYSA